MEAKAYLRNIRIAPRKVQIVLDLIRGKDLKKAQLHFLYPIGSVSTRGNRYVP